MRKEKTFAEQRRGRISPLESAELLMFEEAISRLLHLRLGITALPAARSIIEGMRATKKRCSRVCEKLPADNKTGKNGIGSRHFLCLYRVLRAGEDALLKIYSIINNGTEELANSKLAE
ncbi:hypothetical protein AVEN_122106-1 [Araneus ventricosus]|uniref:Uncharacterized protein n=1 Tax=Araneus ventricosus TaxID=182803 RepID=A0A4Y2PT20_ARAVE|nr:hypothetical protein AVEN_97716-1 [Araneus ventricosus]GBN53266.1 hypothetical protein AVEN_122106-1 [Araneus ventricosus]